MYSIQRNMFSSVYLPAIERLFEDIIGQEHLLNPEQDCELTTLLFRAGKFFD